MQIDGQTEYCFKTIARVVDQLDDDAPVGKQITQQCCEGWYTPEGKPLCSAKNQTYIEHKTGAKSCENLVLEELERSARGSRLPIGYLFIRFLKQKIASLEEKNKQHEKKIKDLEEQLLNLTLNIQTVEVVEFTPPTTERAALSTVDPCDSASCPDHPEAMCMVTSRCGKDVAVFVDENLKTVRCNNEPCDLLPRTFCPDDPCQGLQCVGHPNAFCIVTECDCSPTFMLPDGSRPTCTNEDTFTQLPPTHTFPVIS